MKVLLINPEFPFSFWSYPEGCKLTGAKALQPPLPLMTIAALLPQDWNFRLSDLNTVKINEKDWNWADLVMITGMLVQATEILALIKEAKSRGKKVVIGGPYATIAPDAVLEAGCDFLVIGEAELCISDFLKALERGDTKGVFQSDQKPDLSLTPVPRFDLIKLTDYSTISVQTSRGCPYNCEFCDIVNLFGRKPRYKSPTQVIRELELLKSLGWRGQVFICDDNFVGSKKHARAILSELTPWMEANGKPFGFNTQVSIDLGQDLELIDRMTEANFGDVFIGIESPDEASLAIAKKHQNIKNPLIESVDNINRNGLSVMGSFIIGFDGEKSGAGDRICSFVDRTNLPTVMLSALQAPPRTQLWERLEAEGRLREDYILCEGYEVRQNFIPTRPAAEIIDECVRALNYLYEPTRYLTRCYNYILGKRPTRVALAKQRGEKPPVSDIPKSKLSMRRQLIDFKALLTLIWRQGIRASYRLQWWRQLIGIIRKNPSRLIPYIVFCGLGEDMFRFRKTFTRWADDTRK